jgi:hypothetical protein
VARCTRQQRQSEVRPRDDGHLPVPLLKHGASRWYCCHATRARAAEIRAIWWSPFIVSFGGRCSLSCRRSLGSCA